MIICVCHNVSDKRLAEAAANGAQTLGQAKVFTPMLGGCCGKCIPEAKAAFSVALAEFRSRSSERACPSEPKPAALIAP